jgi:cyd operon protein YbgT
MWYFTWILGLGLALAFGIINVMWLEASYFSGELDEERVRKRFQRGGGRSIDCGVARVSSPAYPICRSNKRGNSRPSPITMETQRREATLRFLHSRSM